MMRRTSWTWSSWMVESPAQTLKPLYWGGLCEAVTMTPAESPSRRTP